ncbi:DUF397 domain-containing protein [Nocardiopsis trehalosi]|jgi:hypothetical protein|uniref:DUF397 domain-containing protein n=1 Tax=Nocardiopsis trehalosi TaxID=109329 RepID=UPI000B0B5F0C
MMNSEGKTFHKSSYSGASSECVEVAEGPTTRVRDTQNRDAATLAVPAREWVALLADLERM